MDQPASGPPHLARCPECPVPSLQAGRAGLSQRTPRRTRWQGDPGRRSAHGWAAAMYPMYPMYPIKPRSLRSRMCPRPLTAHGPAHAGRSCPYAPVHLRVPDIRPPAHPPRRLHVIRVAGRAQAASPGTPGGQRPAPFRSRWGRLPPRPSSGAMYAMTRRCRMSASHATTGLEPAGQRV